MTRLPTALFLAVTLLGCATVVKPPPPPIAMTPAPVGIAAGEFQATGEVVWKDLTGVNPPRRASFDDWRVIGPKVSLTRAPDGNWAGRLGSVEVRLLATLGKVTGPGVELSITSGEKGAVVVDGLWGGRPVHLELGKERITGSLPGRQLDLTDMGSGLFNSYQGLLQITGPPDMPQVVLALLAVFGS
jgi:hypothetical protein